MKNVTDGRMQKLTAIKFSDLPLTLAVKQVRGDGKRVFATFEDPNCGYCKKMAREIAKLDNVTIYTFLYPILSPDSLEKSNQIWCAADKAKAWNDWMIDGKAPGGKGDCDTTAVKKSVETGRKIGHQRHADDLLRRWRAHPRCRSAGQDRAKTDAGPVTGAINQTGDPDNPAVGAGLTALATARDTPDATGEPAAAFSWENADAAARSAGSVHRP